jgi:tRNA modification GTPase
VREGLHKIVSLEETIVAISTTLGRSAIGVIRVSGKETGRILNRLFRSDKPLEHRRATLGHWLDEAGVALDEVVVTSYLAPHSYTGEDLAEISAHGNPFILERLVESVRAVGARLATPGEFTLRAVASGKMDLTQAEGVREFIEAQTQQQARVALRQVEGSASKRIFPAKKDLIDVIARLEAGIDFAEDDVDIPAATVIAAQVGSIRDRLQALQATFGYGRILREGVRLTVLGKPNVGKSSLFNRLLASDRAIVTEIPGTTRDILTELIDLDGIPVRVADTAGVRHTVDQVEKIGVSRSLEALGESDITLVILDGSRPFDEDDEHVLRKTAEFPRLIVINKADLPRLLLSPNGGTGVSVSAVTGAGFDELKRAIREFLVDRQTDLVDDFVLTNERQHEALNRAVAALKAATNAVLSAVPHEMVLLDLYTALSALDEFTGEVVTEDILAKIFSTFCIGK